MLPPCWLLRYDTNKRQLLYIITGLYTITGKRKKKKLQLFFPPSFPCIRSRVVIVCSSKVSLKTQNSKAGQARAKQLEHKKRRENFRPNRTNPPNRYFSFSPVIPVYDFQSYSVGLEDLNQHSTKGTYNLEPPESTTYTLLSFYTIYFFCFFYPSLGLAA